MDDPAFNPPRLALNRIYTRQGDAGNTRLAGGQSVPKDSPRLECYGTVDELSAHVGAARVIAAQAEATNAIAGELVTIQHQLFNLGSSLATLPADLAPRQAAIRLENVAWLEAQVDRMTAQLAPLRSFVLPGATALNAALHLARTVCRRAERLAVALRRVEPVPDDAIVYLNRLSDYFFVASRYANLLAETPEILWDPNRAATP